MAIFQYGLVLWTILHTLIEGTDAIHDVQSANSPLPINPMPKLTICHDKGIPHVNLFNTIVLAVAQPDNSIQPRKADRQDNKNPDNFRRKWFPHQFKAFSDNVVTHRLHGRCPDGDLFEYPVAFDFDIWQGWSDRTANRDPSYAPVSDILQRVIYTKNPVRYDHA